MSSQTTQRRISTRESTGVTLLLVGVALAYLLLFLGLPLFAVFYEALSRGWELYWAAFQEPDAWSAIELTLIAAAIAVPANLVFGVAASWAIAKFEFKGRSLLITLMQSQGKEEEEAAVSLGASGWQTFYRVTLPNIKWGLLYGVILCNARAMGEFGAVSVVSGHIRGMTNTVPLHVEILYNEYNFVAAFAVASLLALLALVTLLVKALVEWQARRLG